MWLNALAALVLAACVAAGAWRGALATGLGIATLVLSYAAAAVFGPALGPVVGAQAGLSGLPATMAASTAVFVVSYALLGLAARLARRWGPQENVGRSPRDRFLGASFGALRGMMLALLVVYLAMWFDALRATRTAAVVPEVGDSLAAKITSDVVQSAIASAVDTSEPGGRFAARFAAQPAVSAADLQSVLDDPNFAQLRNDARFWNDVEDGNVNAALSRRNFLNVADDPQLRQKLARLGLVGDEAAYDPEVFRQSIGQVLAQIGPRLRGLRDDPAMHELMADPKVIAMLQSGDTLGLLAHPKFRELVSRVSAKGG
jgi:membrane protein required for colicin V production